METNKTDPFELRTKRRCEYVLGRLETMRMQDNFDYDMKRTYVVNKGDKLVICTRSSKTGRLHGKNLLVFVAIHELTHMLLDRITGHNEEFINLFKYLVKFSQDNGFYNRIDFERSPVEYCGFALSSNI